jgi:AcrR family transcriptional regulator
VRLGMDGRPVRRRRRDASANRERILRAAGELMRERGDAVRMEDVSAAAGVGKGTLYRNYPSRAALAEALLDDLSRDLQARVLAAAARPGIPALERLGDVIGLAGDFTADNLDLLCMAREGRRDDPRLTAPYLWQRMVVTGLLRELDRDGGDPGYLPDAILGVIDPALVRHGLDTLGLAREDLLDDARRAAGAMAAAVNRRPPGYVG